MSKSIIGMSQIYIVVEYNGKWEKVDGGFWRWFGVGMSKGFVVDRSIKILELEETIYDRTSPSRRRRHVTAETFVATRCPPKLFSSLRTMGGERRTRVIFCFSLAGGRGKMEMEDALVSFNFKLSFFSLLSEKFGGNKEEEEAQEMDFRRKEVKGRLKRGNSSSSSSHASSFFFFFVVPSLQKSLPKSAASTSGAAATLNDAVKDPASHSQPPSIQGSDHEIIRFLVQTLLGKTIIV
ncbi:hypothetical protein TIFTF001_049545 [Ficus carica]|uniref:Uncharacterized protein n=1 Tax=Ficus carica TaxID=3494 RepID=A0AA88CSA2_FICCA|nr:hypothetical protein TIFTF001_049545 [Ficus carica]